jgi:hypothetical protein
MFLRLLAVILACAGIFCLVQQAPSRAGWLPLAAAPAVSCSPGAHASTFIARTSGLSATENTAYCNLINGLDTDGTFSILDGGFPSMPCLSSDGAFGGDYTVAFGTMVTTAIPPGSPQAFLGCNDNGGHATGFDLDTSGKASFFRGGAIVLSSQVMVQNVPLVVVGRRISNTIGIFLNGVLGATATDSGLMGGNTIPVHYYQLYNGLGGAGGTTTMDFTLHWEAWWARGLADWEVQSMSSDPHSFMIYPEDEMFAMMVGAASVPPNTPRTLRLLGVGR